MNNFYFGAMNEYIQASYAPTGRAKCKNCKETIEKDDLRLGIIMDDDHFGGKHYFHPACFTLKPRFQDINPETQIYGLQDLEHDDPATVIQIIKDEVERIKAGKKAAKKSKPAKPKAKKGKSKKSDEDEDEEEQKPKGRITRSRSISIHEDKSKSQAKSKRSASKSQSKSAKGPIKKKTKAKKKAATVGYTAAQKKQFNEYVKQSMMKSADALKAILAANAQSRTGTKIELAEKCADGKLMGKIPMCSSCGGGKLRFNRNTGIYTCPGFMDDDEFRNCNKQFTMSEVVRDPWTEP